MDPAFLAYFKCNNVSSQDTLVVVEPNRAVASPLINSPLLGVR